MESSTASRAAFLDCPEYLDDEGAARCGLPAEVQDRYTLESTGGPLESAGESLLA
jgi:hypothetical protein